MFITAFLSTSFAESDWDDAVADAEALHLHRPSEIQYAWHERERTMFVHFGVATWLGQEYDNTQGSFDLSRINPVNFDADQLCQVAHSWGAELILLVAKHVGGFCWWPTETTDYCVRNVRWRNGQGNLVQEVAEACRQNELKMGVYVYPDDPRYMSEIDRGGRTDDPSKQEEYNTLMRRQWQEVLTYCGSDLVEEVWFDGGCILPLEDIIDSLAPNAVVFEGMFADIRWVGNEQGEAPDPNWYTTTWTDNGLIATPDGERWLPVEADTPLYNHYWFWSAAKQNSRKSVNHLMEMYLNSVGHGAVLLLNSAPDTTGRIIQEDVDTYREFGEEISRQFDHPISTIQQRAGDTITLELPSEQEVNTIGMWEDYRHGQRIRSYTIEAYVNEQWFSVSRGTSVGRRKIDVFNTITTDRLRVIVTNRVGTPLFRKIAAHRTTIQDNDQPISQFVSVRSSSEHSPPYVAQNINDGNLTSRWSAQDTDLYSWIEYDFGRPRRIATTTISELTDRIQAFVIETRNDTSDEWGAVYRGTSVGASFSADFTPVTTRFVRLRVVEIQNLGATIWEWTLDDRPESFELVTKIAPPAIGSIAEIDLSKQIVDPGMYEIQIVGVTCSNAQPTFDGAPGEGRLLQKIEDGRYIIYRTQAIEEWTSTGLRFTTEQVHSDSVELWVRTSQQGNFVKPAQNKHFGKLEKSIQHNNNSLILKSPEKYKRINIYCANGRLIQSFSPEFGNKISLNNNASGVIIVETIPFDAVAKKGIVVLRKWD